MRILVFILSLFPAFLFSQDLKEIFKIDNSIPSVLCLIDTSINKTTAFLEVIDHKYYKLGFSSKHKQSQWVAYLLTKDMVMTNNSKRSNKFKEDKAVSLGSATPKDYLNTGYDKGHICPSADMTLSQKAQDMTFLMSNMSPQRHSFNAGKWKELEESVRKWALQNDSIIIIAGPLFDSIIETIGKNKVSVPYRFYKVIIDISYPTYKAIGFIMENEKLDEDLFHYSMNIDDLEKITGLNFFPDFDDNKDVQALEHNCNLKDWSLKNINSKKNGKKSQKAKR